MDKTIPHRLWMLAIIYKWVLVIYMLFTSKNLDSKQEEKETHFMWRHSMKNLKKISLVILVLFMISFVSSMFGMPLFTPRAIAADGALPATGAAATSNLLGVHIAGLNFSSVGGKPVSNVNTGKLGKNFWPNTAKTFEYFANKGLSLFQVGFRWERMQPQLSGPLDQVYLNALKQDVAWAADYGAKVNLSVTNYGRYNLDINGTAVSCVINQAYNGKVQVTTADLQDLWIRLSNEFKDDPTIYGYSIMAEPHGMGASNWKNISQAVVTSLRNNGDNNLILINGDNWGHARTWEKDNGAPWINDPINNFKYEAHQYFATGGGSYTTTYDQEAASDSDMANRGARWIKPFIDWCNKYGVQGYLGEFGVPASDPRWLIVLDSALTALGKAGMDASCWSGGEHWGNYILSLQPTNNFKVDKPQMAILSKHVGIVYSQ
jgi:endoglucanase